MIYIIADDLTGATDTGVQFSKQGYRTQVVIISEADSQHIAHMKNVPGDIDALVVDTETREADPETARRRIQDILQTLSVKADDIVYKKVDSTLRGNIGVELDECLQVLQSDLCVFTPSLPANKRITVEGYLIVQDQPLGLSEYYNGNLDPEDASYIPYLLEPETDFPVARIDLKHVMRGEEAILREIRKLSEAGKKILVVDAMNDVQLQDILKSSSKFEGTVLYSGSAGLANAISEQRHEVRPFAVQKPFPEKSVLVVSGSMRSIAHRQIDYLKHHINVLCDIPLYVDLLLESRESYLQELLEIHVTQIPQEERQHMLIYPDPRYLDTQITEKILARYSLGFRGLGLMIRDFLGELVKRILDRVPVRNLILTGGDTAIGVCEQLGMHQLTIIEELLPGIPLSLGHLNTHDEVNIVTKAGGFGDENALYLLCEKLMNQRRPR